MIVGMSILILNYFKMTYREFYIWLEGYLTNRLESKHIDISPIVEKMEEVISDEQKWINDFKRYRSIKPTGTIEINNPSE